MTEGICATCSGTRLPPAIIGAERGTCTCRRPGRLVTHLKSDGTYWYEVYFEGKLYAAEPPTLSVAFQKLESLRAAQ